MGTHYDVWVPKKLEKKKGDTCRGMWRAPRKEEVISINAADGLLLAHYKEGYGRICK